MSILTSHMMVTKNPQNVHRKCFWTILVTFIFDVKIDISMCEPDYVNLFFLWTSSIVCVFDFLMFDIFLTFWHLFYILTSFWQLDIFLTTWYLFDIWAMENVGKWVSWLILKIEMGHLGGWGTWVMEHMANGPYGQCGHVLDHVQLP